VLKWIAGALERGKWWALVTRRSGTSKMRFLKLLGQLQQTENGDSRMLAPVTNII
jgi:hypothetical protein